MGTCKESPATIKKEVYSMLTKRMKTELVKTGRAETRKYIYRLNDKDSVKLPFVERIEKRHFGTMAYYTEWKRVPANLREEIVEHV